MSIFSNDLNLLRGSSSDFYRTFERLRAPLDLVHAMDRLNDPCGLHRPGSPFRYNPSADLLRIIEQAKNLP